MGAVTGGVVDQAPFAEAWRILLADHLKTSSIQVLIYDLEDEEIVLSKGGLREREREERE